MTCDLYDEMHVRRELKRAIADAGGVIAFGEKHRLRPRDLDMAVEGLITMSSSILKSVKFVRCVRYAKDESFET